MSSWKKVTKINQKEHRERHQPEKRIKLGPLEKKKQYKSRADDYNQKKKILNVLKQKVLNKNPDEYYFHMVNSKMVDDKHHENVSKDEHTTEQLKLMQTQDLTYIRMKRTQEKKKIDRLQAQLHLLDHNNEVNNKHIYFSDTGDSDNDDNNNLEVHPDLLKYKSNMLSIKKIEQLPIEETDLMKVLESRKQKDRMYKELSKRIDREYQLALVERKFEMDKYVKGSKPLEMKKGTKNTAPIGRWKYQRQH